ncbi:hypothetical protein CALVIDRAFT_595575 [Calocera viscosa TUFC12733]|uniref:Uncharacterized protein n=1 Tax=Calocera viscosa (strain TUFC12733) TaxID=1330018 RepID=A0A167QRT2_CALVF|nr:hypothetical protein CALVIDRAFT_595575 [Calocera viscosa TUFC12733]
MADPPSPPRAPSPSFDELQALLDQSFAHASSLVSSWMAQAPPPRGRAAQGEPEELVRQWRERPARLGLGAPVPSVQRQREGASLSQLNRQLAGAKRKRPDDASEGGKVKGGSDEETEESRSRMASGSSKKLKDGKRRGVFDLPGKKGAAAPASQERRNPFTLQPTVSISGVHAAQIFTIGATPTVAEAQHPAPASNAPLGLLGPPASIDESAPLLPEGKKKKKKKKNKKHALNGLLGAFTGADGELLEEGSTLDTSSIADSASVSLSSVSIVVPAFSTAPRSPVAPLPRSPAAQVLPPASATPEKARKEGMPGSARKKGKSPPKGWRGPMPLPSSDDEDSAAAGEEGMELDDSQTHDAGAAEEHVNGVNGERKRKRKKKKKGGETDRGG